MITIFTAGEAFLNCSIFTQLRLVLGSQNQAGIKGTDEESQRCMLPEDEFE